MITFLRKLINSGLGVSLAIGLVVLLGLGFAAQDIFSNKLNSGVTGGEYVAKVGSERITTSQLD